jgi:hypothetical protein
VPLDQIDIALNKKKLMARENKACVELIKSYAGLMGVCFESGKANVYPKN